MYTHLIDHTSLVLILIVAAAALIPQSAFSQETANKPIRGTIEVSAGDDYEALAQISIEKAREAAMGEFPGSTITESELDEEDGYLVYEVELTHEGEEIEVVVDAGNAAILETEREDDDDDDDDDAVDDGDDD